MKRRLFSNLLGIFLGVILIALFSLCMFSKEVKAASSDTVRVSTSKELKAAIKKTDVKTIIIRTQAYISVTIGANKNAANKDLIIDAPNAQITNKAVFNSITIEQADKYIEKASGNSISDDSGNIVIAKGKTVKSINTSCFKSNYELRKGAKIKSLSMDTYDYFGTVEVLDGVYNSKDRTCAFKYSFGKTIIKFDKSGRIVKETYYDKDGEKFGWSTYEYNNDGYLVNSILYYSDIEKEITTYIYNPDRTLSMTKFTDSKGITYYDTLYLYNEKQQLIKKKKFHNKSFANDIEIITYEYDSKGRLTKCYDERLYYEDDIFYDDIYKNRAKVDIKKKIDINDYEYTDDRSVYISEYEYDKKGFCIKETHIDTDYYNGIPDEDSCITLRKYNKKGDVILYTEYDKNMQLISENKYSYDKLGNRISD